MRMDLLLILYILFVIFWNGSMDIVVWNETNSPWQAFIAGLDLELFIAGTGLDCLEWHGHDFSGDPYWRFYLPLSGEFRLVYSD